AFVKELNAQGHYPSMKIISSTISKKWKEEPEWVKAQYSIISYDANKLLKEMINDSSNNNSTRDDESNTRASDLSLAVRRLKPAEVTLDDCPIDNFGFSVFPVSESVNSGKSLNPDTTGSDHHDNLDEFNNDSATKINSLNGDNFISVNFDDYQNHSSIDHDQYSQILEINSHEINYNLDSQTNGPLTTNLIMDSNNDPFLNYSQAISNFMDIAESQNSRIFTNSDHYHFNEPDITTLNSILDPHCFLLSK
ncbi:13252_t:CDS:1, partial [Ambispora gerdemannii]